MTKKIKIVIIGDIHGNIESVKYITLLLREIEFDYILMVGDIGLDYDKNDEYEKIIGLYYIEVIFKLLNILKKPIYYVPGNHDHVDMHKFIKLERLINVDYLHNGQFFKNRVLNVLGIGGSPVTLGKWTYEDMRYQYY